MKVACSMDLGSMHRLMNNLRMLLIYAIDEAGNELHNIGSKIMSESHEACPRDTWTLVSSSYVDKAVNDGKRIIVKLGYGGKADKQNPKTGKMASEYMMTVHENLLGHHYKVGGPKFLENPVRENKNFMKESLGQALRATLSYGGKKVDV